MGANHDGKPQSVGGCEGSSALQQLTAHLRSGSVASLWSPGLLRRHHLLLTVVTLLLTLALLVHSLAPHRTSSTVRGTRQMMGRLPAFSGSAVPPRREVITAEGWVSDILAVERRLRPGLTADEPTGHPIRHVREGRPDGSFYFGIPSQGAWLDAAEQEQYSVKPLCGVLSGTTLDPKGLWLRDADTGHLFWEPSRCRLRRLTGQQARECFAGRHIAFVGDSVTRFQFISLLHLLIKLVYPERYGRDDAQSLVIPHQYGPTVGFDWNVYYKILMDTMSTGTNVSVAAEGNTKHSLGKEDLGFVLSGMRRDGWLRTKLGDIQLSLNFTGFSPVTNFEDTAIQNLHWAGSRADAVLANVGLWWSKHVLSILMGQTDTTGPAGDLLGIDAGPVIRHIIEGGLAGAATRKGNRPRMIWKTTTAVGLRRMLDDEEMLRIYNPVGLALFDMKALADIEALGNPWEVLDAHAVTEAAKDQRLRLSYDAMHFLPIVYEQLNDLLLNMLCDERNHWAG